MTSLFMLVIVYIALQPWWKKEMEDLPRHPPDVVISASELKAELVCNVCKGYIYNATTIAECMHTCKIV